MTLRDFLHKGYYEDDKLVGFLITFKDDTKILIGHLNALGGECDDCPRPMLDEEVKFSERIWNNN